ncbi:hypothetical protein FDP41_001251 [Naegleria fowleri]|uniref:Uncharacterized protein n=1 Tax=Naegleria fowleri TaxID=5763 RepID=A0A6A5BNL0_NAEFO|nr:uncharacterized protein FDP41_001251 [Naegleria fowleri]KAF0979583.1 hypothetical protein FDP41_001251 [Naegleria fowleri]
MRSSVSMQHTSDEELLCASLMRNSREIKAFFNSKLMYLVRDAQYLALIGIRSVQQKLGAYSSLEGIKELMDNLAPGTTQHPNPSLIHHNNSQEQLFTPPPNQQHLSTPEKKSTSHEDMTNEEDSRYKPSSSWRKGDRQGIQLSSGNEDQFDPYLPDKHNNIQASPMKKSNNNYLNHPAQHANYLPTPSSPFFDETRFNVPSRLNGNVHQNFFNTPIPHVHDYFSPYQNSNPYQSYPLIPPTTYIHYPSYPSHPLNTPTIVHHVAPQQPQRIEFQNHQTNHQTNQQTNQQQVEHAHLPEQKPSKRADLIVIQKEEISPAETEDSEGPPKAVAWSAGLGGNVKKKKSETPKKEIKKPPVKKLHRHASVPPKFGVPYDINKVESKIKGQIMMDKKTNQHAMHEPVLVTSKKEMIEKLPTEGHSSDPIRQEIAENEPKQNVQATSNKPPLSQPQQVQPTAQASHSLKQQDVSKQPTRKVPSKRLEEILYQRKKVDSPRTEKESVLSIVEKFMNDPYLKDFY